MPPYTGFYTFYHLTGIFFVELTAIVKQEVMSKVNFLSVFETILFEF